MNELKRALAFTAALALVASGGGSTEDRERELEREAAKHGLDADVELDDRGEVRSVEVKRSGQRIGQNLSLPDEFPSDVAVSDAWSVMHTTPAPQGGYMIQATTPDAVDAILAETRAAMAADGWSETAFDQPTPQMTSLGFDKDDRLTRVTIIDAGDGQRSVQLVTMKKT
ncbi:MAG: hypothetical protein ACFB00_04625 [Parvularculaceae bacterium]